MDEAPPPLPSQASSHFPLEPVSGATLFEQEVRRRDALARRGTCLTGCRELDDEVLLGGFERGCVVGISAEEEEMGLLVSVMEPGARLPLRQRNVVLTRRVRLGCRLSRGCLSPAWGPGKVRSRGL